MLQSWRWYGPGDPVTLAHIRQAGASGVVTALHHLYGYDRWSVEDVLQHKALVEKAGLRWDVCESIPVPTSIKTGGRTAREDIEIWAGNLDALGQAGVPVVCFNFMPVLDWTRTDLRWQAPSGGLALRFDLVEFACFDIHVLRRDGAAEDYPPEIVEKAADYRQNLDDDGVSRLTANIIEGLPGGEGRYTLETLKQELRRYEGIDRDRLRANLFDLLEAAIPVAERHGLKLVIHPDDPPRPLFGLPRVVSDPEDLRKLFQAVPSPAMGMVLCTGSYGVRETFDPVAMVEEFGSRIHFAHLRNVQREPDGSFFESDHLDGSVDMVAAIRALMAEEAKRQKAGEPHAQIPMRPDHGHLLIDDIDKTGVNPGYSCIGRLKGLAELRGVMRALSGT